ncbi:hypothetical protein AAFF_G00348180 [Aldrovandia affinis]|uniref:Uncharacterized protein n=1 Tax=Aldrovandia affinis TaxID=143900 RepID=A0AAD7R5J7_9TELE|nr:hypothetical protein AAFF_G00348180 [Aldrovandia affinis]
MEMLSLALLFGSLGVAASSSSCPSECSSRAPGGLRLVPDGRGGCREMCARQLNEDCSRARPCDRAKGLRCNFGASVHATTGICRAKSEGRPCEYNSRIYQNGETFRPNCKHLCTCRDGAVGCTHLCPQELPLPNRPCGRARLLKVPGRCCEERACDRSPHRTLGKPGRDESHSDLTERSKASGDESENELIERSKTSGDESHSDLNERSKTSGDESHSDLIERSKTSGDESHSDLIERSKTSGDESENELIERSKASGDESENDLIERSKTSGDESENDLIERNELIARVRVQLKSLPAFSVAAQSRSFGGRRCIARATGWSQCSRTCGAGVSTRVTNDNRACRPVRETRGGLVRSCFQSPAGRLKGWRCRQTRRSPRSRRFSHVGCSGLTRFWPKSCASCRPQRARPVPVPGRGDLHQEPAADPGMQAQLRPYERAALRPTQALKPHPHLQGLRRSRGRPITSTPAGAERDRDSVGHASPFRTQFPRIPGHGELRMSTQL